MRRVRIMWTPGLPSYTVAYTTETPVPPSVLANENVVYYAHVVFQYRSIDKSFAFPGVLGMADGFLWIICCTCEPLHPH